MSHKVVIPIGPYHPLQEEPEFFRLYVEGEKVVDIDIVIGYMHRGIEELSEHKHFDQVAFWLSAYAAFVLATLCLCFSSGRYLAQR